MGKIDKFPYSDCIFCTVFVQKSNFFTNKLDAVLRREIHPARQRTENGADTSKTRRAGKARGRVPDLRLLVGGTEKGCRFAPPVQTVKTAKKGCRFAQNTRFCPTGAYIGVRDLGKT